MNLLGNPIQRSILFSCLIFVAAHVEAAENSSQSVQVTIRTILASNQSDDFDSRLNPFQKQLKVMKYRSYRLLKEESQTVPWQGNAAFEIPGSRSLAVSPQEFRDKQISLKVRLQEGEKPLVDTTVRLQNKGNFILGGPPHEGGFLILSISATSQ